MSILERLDNFAELVLHYISYLIPVLTKDVVVILEDGSAILLSDFEMHDPDELDEIFSTQEVKIGYEVFLKWFGGMFLPRTVELMTLKEQALYLGAYKILTGKDLEVKYEHREDD